MNQSVKKVAACTVCFVTGIICLLMNVPDLPEATDNNSRCFCEKNPPHTCTQHMHACRISLSQPKHNGQGQWLFPLFFWGALSPSVCGVTLPGPPPVPPPPVCPLRDICRGRLCGPDVGWLSGGRWQLDREHVISKKERQNALQMWRKRAALTDIMVSIHHKRELPAKRHIFFFGLSKHFTGSVFNTKPVIKGVQTAWGREVERQNRGSFACFSDT